MFTGDKTLLVYIVADTSKDEINVPIALGAFRDKGVADSK